jgi:acyl carrier protein
MSRDLLVELRDIACDALQLEGDLPEGDLAEHFDSIQRLAFVVAIEDHFEIAFAAEDDEAIKTVDDVLRIIRDRLASPDA